ncbi:MAG TPA: glycoside hydrolase family 2 TIM barrel-domain containing protein [Cyclobacteriaceae bacterium]|nr:glycoside hydrolase family 2 TIM barrel-domain containing protein [Cyclobacteriaceae bacterium]
MRFILTISFLFIAFLVVSQIPLPEHPRPDFERAEWQNLNGVWSFEFDKDNVGVKENWQSGNKNFSKTISVPFPWGSPLSGIKDEADIAWYQRTINVPALWNKKRTFVTIGASDYETTVYFDGKEIGKHTGGYTPFSFELTSLLKYGEDQKLTFRVDDKRRMFALYGKQGYGDARGIWQTVYLEARGKSAIDFVRFIPDIDKQQVHVEVGLVESSSAKLSLSVSITGNGAPIEITKPIDSNQKNVSLDIAIPNAQLWSLENPFLYNVTLKVSGNGAEDIVKTYFGMRKISVMNLPGTDFPYVALNNKPIYLQLTLDQSYHPEGFYTFPSDEFMKKEIVLARSIGLNGIRTHIKIDVPRKLYWADRLGMLVMSDLPNFWGQPDAEARKESEATMPEMIKRDFNHPAIFSWILFNETWGLRSKVNENGKAVNNYLPETQKWVTSMVESARKLDKTRLIEDNSICCGAGHTVTDMNTWHEYLPGWEWESFMDNLNKNTYEGSTFHFEKGYAQGKQPMLNSECGNVWGYDGSTGDVDYSWDYHRMMNTFRKYPKMAGWLYTEHHDVINEWNGYWRFDRSQKFTGVEEIVKGMTLNDFHSLIYISTGNEISRAVKPGEKVKIPLYLSSMTGRHDLGNALRLRVELSGVDAIGQKKTWSGFSKTIPYQPYANNEVESIEITAPNEKALVTVALILEDGIGNELHHNFFHVIVEGSSEAITLNNGRKATVVTVEPKNFSASKWSLKQWDVLDGSKINGAGAGYFEYKFKIPAGQFEAATFIAEIGGKELFVKDMGKEFKKDGDYMLGAKTSPSASPNAYPMTDETVFAGAVSVSANGIFIQRVDLPDDPADHRGVLSWHYQPKVRKLNEAGSYGYRVAVNLTKEILDKARPTGEIVIRLESDAALGGGLAIYGDKFGRYPMNPGIVFFTK